MIVLGKGEGRCYIGGRWLGCMDTSISAKEESKDMVSKSNSNKCGDLVYVALEAMSEFGSAS